jgi:crotonobetainyl-CoA:carnitine CoA-transferase CaiB-like acyl-CoA transferase
VNVLEGYGVLEIEPTIATSMVGRYLADLGASVTIVEPPGGHPLRREPPFDPASGESLLFAYLQHGKSSLVSDTVSAEGQAEVAAVLAASDLVVHSLTTPALRDTYGWTEAGPLAVGVSAFGDLGPRAGEVATDLTVAAASGLLWLTGYPDAAPALHYGHQPAYFAALAGTVAALAALLDPGSHRWSAVSEQEVFAGALEDTVPNTALRGVVRRRVGNSLPSTGPLTNIYASKDGGGVSLCVFIEPQWEMFCALVERPEWLEDERFRGWPLRAAHGEEIREVLEAWCGERTAEEAFDALQTYRIPASILLSPAQLFEEPQAKHRGLMQDVRLASGATVLAPGLPFASALPTTPGGDVPRPGEPATRAAPRRRSASLARDLASIRVLDLTHAWAGPFATMHLGDLGCDVVKIESAARVDQTRLGTPVKSHDETFYPGVDIVCWFQQYNRNKRSLSIELKHPEGHELFMRLVAISDVVIDNFSGRVMPQLGLGFEQLSAVNPGIVQVRLTGFGLDGPYANTVAYGESLEAATGLAYLTRSQGRPLRSGIAYPDVAGGYHGTIAVLAGLVHRERTGRGVLIDVSERDGTIRLAGEAFAESSLTGTNWLQESSEHPRWSPSGVYPCTGEERWVAISCTSDEAWRALAQAIDAADLGVLSLAERRARRAEIDGRIAAWTAGLSREDAAGRLQALGVEAEPVLDIADLLRDRQLIQSGSLVTIDHPAIEGLIHPGSPITVEGRRRPIMHAPAFGEHSDAVLRGLLGLDDREIARLEAAGAVKQMPVLG